MRNATLLPEWLRDERERLMKVDDRIRFCTGFVGTGRSDDFVAHGTCFCAHLTEDGFVFDYLISARHVLWPQRNRNPKEPPDLPMKVRLNTEKGASQTIPAPPREWLYPDDTTVDLCAFRFDGMKHNQSDELQVNSINLLSMVVHPNDVHDPGVGDEVFICGAFVGRVGYRKNIPVVRIANIAAMPEEPIDFASPKKAAYLIETRSLGGTSGSPVFLNLDPTRVRRRAYGYKVGITPSTEQADKSTTHLILPYMLLGVIIFSHGGNYAQDFVSESDSDIHPLKDVEFNAGIAVALPIQLVIDLLNSDKAKALRMKEIEEKRKRSGARPASAIPADGRVLSSHQATDENPNAREDFTSLLNAAARKPKQDG